MTLTVEPVRELKITKKKQSNKLGIKQEQKALNNSE
jgi:hypothetical protein